MTDLRWVTATQVARLVREREVSVVEVVEETLQTIATLNPQLNAYLTVTASEARAAAEAADEAVHKREPLGPLHGVPVSIKDSEPTRGIPTTSGSTLLRGHVPDADSIAVARVRAAGGIIIGKTNLPEFCLLGETKNQLGEPCRNPWDPTKTTGGSSGGAAAAVAAGMGPLALGSDSAGSITAPAGFCGVFGLKPSQGRIPNDGPRFATSSGPLARSAEDLELMLRALSGQDPRDPRSVLFAGRSQPARSLRRRIRWSPDLGHLPVDGEVQATVARSLSRLEDAGWRIDSTPVDIRDPWSAYLPIFWAESGQALADVVRNHAEELLPEAQAELEPMRTVDASRLLSAIHESWGLQAEFARIFETSDLLATPATAVPAFPHDEPPDRIGGVSVEPNWTTFMPFGVVANLTGCPAVAVPCGHTQAGLPVGALLLAPVGEDEALLSAAAELAAHSDCVGQTPPDRVASSQAGT